VEPEHLRLMLNCAELCHTAANFMLSRIGLHSIVCVACAEVCTACADSCEDVGDMDECVQACRRCAKECQSMGRQPMLGQDRAGVERSLSDRQ
jgi:hypothetical protein